MPDFQKNTTDFTPAELRRYARHFALPGFGPDGQVRLKKARVLVVGAGGLGCPALQYLAAAGVGCIGIADGDRVDESNLHRQVLYTFADLGRLKVEVARERLLAQNPNLRIEIHAEHLTRHNALKIIGLYDVVADGTDNFPTRYLINDACVLAGKTNVFASVFRFEGQVAVFNAPLPDGSRGVNYRDLFPDPPPPGLTPDCAEGGVLGVLPGIVGAMQAAEVIKILAGVGEPLTGRLFVFDASTFSARTLRIPRNPTAPKIVQLIDYEQFCGILPASGQTERAANLTAEILKKMMADGVDFQLVDVREPHEFALGNLGGVLIPLGELPARLAEIEREKMVVVHCQTGARSARAVDFLRQQGFQNAVNLEGGYEAFFR